MKNNKKYPRTLDECMKQNNTVDNLNLWAERLQQWGKILFAVLILAGIIATVANLFTLEDYDAEYVFPTIISSVISWGLYAFIEYCAYHALSLLISALALITENSIITANVALFESGKNSHAPLIDTDLPTCDETVAQLQNDNAQTQSPTGNYFNRTIQVDSYPSTPPQGGWVCSCGRTNASYVSSCSCGKNKRDIL